MVIFNQLDDQSNGFLDVDEMTEAFKGALRDTVAAELRERSRRALALIGTSLQVQEAGAENMALLILHLNGMAVNVLAVNSALRAFLLSRYRNPKNEAERRLHMKYPNEHKFYLDAMRRFAGLLVPRHTRDKEDAGEFHYVPIVVQF